MTLGHEKLDVYRLSMDYVAWVWALDQKQYEERKGHLDRIAAMLSKLGGRGYTVKEGSTEYGTDDPDPDFDSDFDRQQSQPMAGGDSASRNTTA